ncbi:putative lipid II flippase FtsW [Microbacterium sp.]|uniref:putative lipid II flippase FtsW n=1 Tax=Microbacterium sp. TaxID=51671 RepID=UPI00333E7288
MTQTARPGRTDRGPSDAASRGGLAARVSLGRLFTPVSTEFLLISSAALLLTVFGLVMVLSATSANPTAPFEAAIKQGVFALLGVPLMFVISRIPIRLMKKFAWPVLIGSVLLQLLVFVPGLGVSSDGNQNWIRVAGFTMQPSEFMKLALAIWIAFVLLRKEARLGIWHHVFIPVVPVSMLAIGTVLAGHDLGTAMIIVLVVLGCLFFAGVKLRLFIIPVLLGGAAVGALAIFSGDRMRRINADCSDMSQYGGNCYQAIHGIWGMAKGGFFGVGLGNSQEKYGWLPAAANDYIFAIVGEELGLIGCVLVLGLLTAFAIGAFRIIRRSPDQFVRVASGGIVVWIVGQALINVGVVIGIFPVLGVPLPFMSQGGTALLSVLMASGVLLAFSRTLPAAAPAETSSMSSGRGGKGKVTR